MVAELKAARERLAATRLAEQRLLSGRVEALTAELAAAHGAGEQVSIDQPSADSLRTPDRPDMSSPPIDRVHLADDSAPGRRRGVGPLGGAGGGPGPSCPSIVPNRP